MTGMLGLSGRVELMHGGVKSMNNVAVMNLHLCPKTADDINVLK